jgi:hypothetical protein
MDGRVTAAQMAAASAASVLWRKPQRFDRGRRHHLDAMAQRGDRAGPGMGAAAGLEADKARRQAAKKRQHLRAAQRTANEHFAICGDGVHLKHGLGQIQPDWANLLHGTVLPVVSMNSTTLGTFRCRLEGPFHTITVGNMTGI